MMPGPAEVLFQREYYALLKAALRSGGILISQGMRDIVNDKVIYTELS